MDAGDARRARSSRSSRPRTSARAPASGSQPGLWLRPPGAADRSRVRSEVGAGTTVSIYLPHSHGDGRGGPARDGPCRCAAPTDGEVVLVVEDEPAVLEMAVESLGELGYRTLTATHAAEALDRLRGRSASTSCSPTW